MLLPVNEDENSRTVIETGEYQYPKSKGIEDVWLIRYLKTDGENGKEDIYTIWCRIAKKKYDYFSEEELRANFERFWKAAGKKSKGPVVFPIEIFQEEIDAINNADTFIWVKQYALLLLAYYKILGKEKNMGGGLSWELLKFVTAIRPKARDCKRATDLLIKCGLLEIRDFAWILNYQCKKGHLFGRFYQIKDMQNIFSELKTEKVCTMCGKTFCRTSKTKRDICEECWKKKEVKRVQKYRSYKEMDTTVKDGEENKNL